MRVMLVTVCSVVLLNCGGEGGTTAATGTATGTSSGGTSTGGEGSTGGPSSSGDVPTTSADTNTGEGTSTTSSSSSGSSGAEVSSGEPETTTTGGTTGGGLDCTGVTAGPFTAELFVSGFSGSEDLAFDGKGGLALKRDGDIVVVRADKSETTVAMNIPQAYGSRYLADGRLLVALPGDGVVIAVDAQGASTDFLGGLGGPNGIYPDIAGAVWITEFGGSRLLRIDADQTETTMVTGGLASSANGVVYDPLRALVFYTNYQGGQVRRVAIDAMGMPGEPELVTMIDGAPDGLALDACGNLYIVDQGNSRVFRALLDELGEASEPASELAEFPSNVANAQFGVGEGFDAQTLYLAGNPGDVYTLALEFPGAPIVSVQ